MIGGPCEGCEAIFEYGNQKLDATDTLPEFTSHPNKMLITGTVYQRNGVTPAAGVIIYAYQTNEKGVYPTKGDESGWARRHGYLRAWVKTDSKGQYAFYTFKPASYPSRTEPAHVHLIVKEPGKNEYWLDSIEFDDDPLLTAAARNKKRKRGGSGIVRLSKQSNGHLLCQRDIILGKNIPGYPD
ncbi:MAG: hypothetical protein Roseis2KO_32090 [Roseivirga sp.]